VPRRTKNNFWGLELLPQIGDMLSQIGVVTAALNQFTLGDIAHEEKLSATRCRINGLFDNPSDDPGRSRRHH
jgi:hypothetical protein